MFTQCSLILFPTAMSMTPNGHTHLCGIAVFAQVSSRLCWSYVIGFPGILTWRYDAIIFTINDSVLVEVSIFVREWVYVRVILWRDVPVTYVTGFCLRNVILETILYVLYVKLLSFLWLVLQCTVWLSILILCNHCFSFWVFDACLYDLWSICTRRYGFPIVSEIQI